MSLIGFIYKLIFIWASALIQLIELNKKVLKCKNYKQYLFMNQVVIKVIGNYSYQTSRCLGQGVYGKVYQGMERETKQKVAIKKIDLNTFTNDKYLENAIFSEIYLLKRFNHPNIVRFKDVLSSKNSLYIITEFCKNGDLKQLIKRKRFKQQQAFDIMKQLLSGFSQLVRQKIIHRDLKPANILISEGVYKIGDFGFAKYVDNFGSQMLKSCVGSPIYMAPQILQRTQYTTKCDIWSLGVIFYQMIHGYPPWKARDQSELLRSVKNIPITHVLKKSNLSQRGNQFLKRALAFSQQQRIGWNQLFQDYGNKKIQTKHSQDSFNEPLSALLKKQRITSMNTVQTGSMNLGLPPHRQSSGRDVSPSWTHQQNTNTNSPYSHATHPHNSSPSINTHQHSPYSTNTSSNLLMAPDRKPSYYSSSSNSNTHISSLSRGDSLTLQSNYNTPSLSSKKSSQVDNLIQWRQYLVYYHFYCIEMLVNFTQIQGITCITPKPQLFSKFIFGLANFIKNRSTYCLSMIVMHSKTNKSVQEIYKKMQNEHQSYQMTYNDIVSILQRHGQYKNIRNQYISVVGHNQIISQDRMQKMESFMITAATQNAQVLSEEVKKRVKVITNKDYSLVEVLDNVLDVLRLALGKNKSIRDIQEDQRHEDEDIKDYVARVFGKVDRLATNM